MLLNLTLEFLISSKNKVAKINITGSRTIIQDHQVKLIITHKKKKFCMMLVGISKHGIMNCMKHNMARRPGFTSNQVLLSSTAG